MTLRVGIVGTGWVAQARHIPGFRSHPEAEVVAVFDRKPERASEVASLHRIRHWGADLNEFLDRGLDVVSIATPPWTHSELATAILERGIHVLTEKPMAMSLAEGEGMARSADAAGRILCVSHNFLFSRSVRKAMAFLGPDPRLIYVGGLQLSSLRRRLPTWYERLPGGLLFDEMPHLLYLLQHFLGRLEVEEVRARQGAGSAELNAVEVLVRGTRASGQITMVVDAPVSEWQLALVSPRGVVVLDLFRDIAVRLRPDGAHRPLDILRSSAKAVFDHAVGFGSSGARYVTGRLTWGHEELIRRFVDAVLGQGAVPVSIEEALGVVRLADHIVSHLLEDEKLG